MENITKLYNICRLFLINNIRIIGNLKKSRYQYGFSLWFHRNDDIKQ
jgi:hypothetical protein